MSVRELSVLYSVTPKTIQAVTSYLSLNNIIDKKPGVGSVITNDLNVVKEVHDLHGKENTFEYVTYMKSLHYSDEEILSFIKRVMKEERHD
jgi:DNA-binding transcriptional regulator YhcF (GntR family)